MLQNSEGRCFLTEFYNQSHDQLSSSVECIFRHSKRSERLQVSKITFLGGGEKLQKDYHKIHKVSKIYFLHILMKLLDDLNKEKDGKQG